MTGLFVRPVAFIIVVVIADKHRNDTYRVVHPLRRKKKRPRAPQLEAVLLHRCARKQIRHFVPSPPPPPPPPPPPTSTATAMMLIPSSLACSRLALSLSSRSTNTTRATNAARPFLSISFSLFCASLLSLSLPFYIFTERTGTRHSTLNTNKTNDGDDDVPSTSSATLSIFHTPTKTHGRKHARAHPIPEKLYGGRENHDGRTAEYRDFSCRADRATGARRNARSRSPTALYPPRFL